MQRQGKLRSWGRRPAAALVAGIALALTISLPAALGHKATYDTHLQLKIDTITDTTNQYSGKVTSQRGACEVGRSITVTSSGVPIAFATTNVAGDWTAMGSRPPKGTDVVATTPRKVLKRNRKHRHKCAPAAVTHKAP